MIESAKIKSTVLYLPATMCGHVINDKRRVRAELHVYAHAIEESRINGWRVCKSSCDEHRAYCK